jgi:hypothetical protein
MFNWSAAFTPLQPSSPTNATVAFTAAPASDIEAGLSPRAGRQTFFRKHLTRSEFFISSYPDTSICCWRETLKIIP